MLKKLFILWLILTFAGPVWLLASGQVNLEADYRTANRDSAGIAPLPSEYEDVVIHVYSARAFNWRGMFGSHSWIATKEKGADTYTVYQVVGWRTYRNMPALAIEEDIPDRYWYDAKPMLILDIRGEKAERLIPQIITAAKTYPYAEPYHVWPGPNSNTFPAYVGREVPELGLVMPANAVGKDLLMGNTIFARAPSGTGYQISLFGVLGLTLAAREGIEINLLGVIYGIRFAPFSILLPGFDD